MNTLLRVTAALFLVIFLSCKGNQNSPENTGTDSTAALSDSARATTVYTCPMHPEVVSDNPGTCPKCGMDLEPRS